MRSDVTGGTCATTFQLSHFKRWRQGQKVIRVLLCLHMKKIPHAGMLEPCGKILTKLKILLKFKDSFPWPSNIWSLSSESYNLIKISVKIFWKSLESLGIFSESSPKFRISGILTQIKSIDSPLGWVSFPDEWIRRSQLDFDDRNFRSTLSLLEWFRAKLESISIVRSISSEN